MGSHLRAIGFPSDGDLRDAIRRLLPLSGELGSASDGSARVLVHEDPSGSRITLTLEGPNLVCLTPTFRPGQPVRVRVDSFAPDECRYERPLVVGVLDNGDELYPLAVQIEDLALGEDRFPGGEVVELEIAALAETIELFPDEPAFRATGTPMATRSLIPSGLFAPPGSSAEEGAFTTSPRILVTGEVTDAELRTHTLLGGSFVRVTVATYGASLPVLVAAADLADASGTIVVPPFGAIVRGTFWVSGRLLGASALS